MDLFYLGNTFFMSNQPNYMNISIMMISLKIYQRVLSYLITINIESALQG